MCECEAAGWSTINIKSTRILVWSDLQRDQSGKRDLSNKIQDVLSLGAVQEFHTSVVSSLGATIEYLASC